jgi:hypothetical protein
MARREIIVDDMDADERVYEQYGVLKSTMLRELHREQRVVHRQTNDHYGTMRHAHPVAGPTHEAMMKPEFRRYIEGGSNADPEVDAQRVPA